MKVIDSKKERYVFEDICWQLDKEENEYLPQVEISELTLKFQEIHFGHPETRGITVKNVGQSPVSLSFIPKIDEIDICKPWLSISPESSVINTTESIELQFTIEIKEEIASTLDKDKNLEDILILHLEGGKDFFITIQATYIASCFGSSLEYLSHLRVPFFQARVPTGNLIDVDDVTAIPEPASRYIQSLMLDDNVELPQELVAMVEYLKEHAGKTENLFQERGLKWEMDNIRKCLDKGDPLTGSVHSIAACLITFLAALENPVIPFHLQMKCLDASSNYTICKQVVLKELPESHKTTFRYLIRFLNHLLRDNALYTLPISHIFGSILLRSEYNLGAKSKMEQNPNRDELSIAKKKTTFIYQFLTNTII
ncbi:hypothetical protein LOD99_4422 [Oopsacas minuta]|uniref:Rho-GAP domain-containing protein n=1 Tax=Oopsacas minuta TaxID=111878 RepID=A0AAV7JUR1_9METZ|nr:hypothetical protein LOD99_4422 [Oopsacas minuta]